MHSTIERKIVADIFTPRDYVVVLQTARIRSSPYYVKVLKHSEFLKLNGSYFFSIRPGKKVGDPTVHDLRVFSLAVKARSISSCPFQKTLCGKNCHKECRCQMGQWHG